jgi:hypothetical protein
MVPTDFFDSNMKTNIGCMLKKRILFSPNCALEKTGAPLEHALEPTAAEKGLDRSTKKLG